METLGTKFKSARGKKKLSLEEVSQKTKIRLHIIQAFEDGNFAVLPPVYAKSFLITYSKFLDIPFDEINEELEELFKAKTPEPVQINIPEDEKNAKDNNIITKYNLAKDDKTKIINWLIYSILFIGIILVIYFSFFSTPEINNDNLNGNINSEIETSDTTIIKPTENNLFEFIEEPDSVILQAKANDSAWLKISIDGKKTEQTYLYPKSEKRWSAANYFVLTLGNAGAVEFTRNGLALQPLGALGTVVRNVKITADTIINSSNPWGKDTSVTKHRRRYRRKKHPIPMDILKPSTIEKTNINPLEELKPPKNESIRFKPKPIKQTNKKEKNTPK